MGRSANYCSPSKKIHSLSRLVSYFRKKLYSPKETSKALPLTNLSPHNISPNARRMNLTTTTTSVTNFPDPCKVCNSNQCQYDFSHQLYFTISGTIEKTFDEFSQNGALEKALDEMILKLEPPNENPGACGI